MVKIENKMKKGSLWISAGISLIVFSFGFVTFNCLETMSEKKNSLLAIEGLDQSIINVASKDNSINSIPDYILNPNMNMPVQKVDGHSYVGVIEVPSLELRLPVQDEWSYPNMKISPCLYKGTAYLKNMVICAHNSSAHFGAIKTLNQGDSVYFTDIDGNQFEYQVKVIEILSPTDVNEMICGDWDLTLFTCTLGGGARVTVRCNCVNE